jgi:hypothetical protein
MVGLLANALADISNDHAKPDGTEILYAAMSYTHDGNGERVLKSNTSTRAPVKRYWSMGGNTPAKGDGREMLLPNIKGFLR